MTLYGYWRSSASWRVRIALHLKGLAFTYVPVNLLTGENLAPTHRARNALGQVPVLELPDGTLFTQSLAIIDLLDDLHPANPIRPADPVARARAMSLAEVVNAGIQPLQNLLILNRLTALGVDRTAWSEQAISEGLAAFEAQAAPHAGRFCVGDSPTMADLVLIPQLYNARRFGCDLSGLGLLTAIEARCEALPAFQAAHPDRQPDATQP